LPTFRNAASVAPRRPPFALGLKAPSDRTANLDEDAVERASAELHARVHVGDEQNDAAEAHDVLFLFRA
jgi:hypothetical protein